MLSGLRQMLGDETLIWVGGGAFHAGGRLPDGVELLGDLYEVEQSLAAWKRRPETDVP